MKRVVVLILISLFFGCNKKEDSEVQKPYIISQEDRKNSERDKKNNVPPPFIPNGISLENNIIIDKHSNIYYYQRNKRGVFCNYGMENDTIPKFIDLQPKDLLIIPKDCMAKFIDENVMTKEKRRQILIIASQTDTIKDQKISSFLYHIKVPTYIIRRTTQEEDTVLSYKKKNAFYYSDEIKWDKSKIRFPDQVKFAKP
jgi:hypothetical protein